MAWAFCEFCQGVEGVMWNNPATTIECGKCGAWLSVERPDGKETELEE